jgi:hypothetical protein
MANRFKGKVTTSVEGQEYTLVLDFNSMAEFEDRNNGKNALDVLQAMEQGKGSARDMRALVHVCLLTHQPDATAEEAGDILSEDPGVIARLVAAAMPDAAKSSAAGNVKARRTGRA